MPYGTKVPDWTEVGRRSWDLVIEGQKEQNWGMKKTVWIFAVLVFLLLPFSVFAHPGNTDKYGCHTCRTNCTKWGLSYGEYHCHRSKGLIQPKEPVKSQKSDTVGSTMPAPEYKEPIKVETKVEVTTKNEPQGSFFRRFLGIFRR